MALLEHPPLEVTAPAPRGDRRVSERLHERVGWSVAALLVLLAACQAWSVALMLPAAVFAVVAVIIGCLVTLWRCWAAPERLAVGWQWFLILAAIGCLALTAVQTYLLSSGYGSDAAAFNQYAAQLLLAGQNPYTVSMAPALELFHVSPDMSTWRMDGTAVDALSYPAGSFLVYVPLLLLGVQTQAANILDMACWALGLMLLWFVLPRSLRWLPPVLLTATFYVGYAIGGVTDTVFVPLVILALWRWDRFRDAGERSAARWLGPYALGLALTMKQLPWFLLPFLLLGVAFAAGERGERRVRAALAYLVRAMGVFAVVNLPFVMWDPGAWLAGVLVPFLEPTVPDGQGLVSLSIYGLHGAGHLVLFSLAGAVYVAGCLGAYCLRHRLLKRTFVPLVALAFVFPSRSLASYLVMLLPAAVVAYATVRPAAGEPFLVRARLVRRWFAVAAVLVVGVAGLALSSPPPLDVQITGLKTTGAWQSVQEVSVRVTNRTGYTMTPTFSVNSRSHASTPWHVGGGSGDAVAIPPHAARVLRLLAPNSPSMPQLGGPFFVMAFTSGPGAVSVSDRYVPSPLSVELSPMSVDRLVAADEPVTITAALRDRLGAPVHRAGVRVRLSQVVYAQESLIPGNSSINGKPQGQSPVAGVTDANGEVRFVVRGLQPQSDPIYYQAWVAERGHVPYGYSDALMIRFVPPSGTS